MSSFVELGLSEDIAHGVQSMGFVDPTPIQTQSIPVILQKKDLLASAQTGTGKTAAFGLPILSMLGTHGKLRALILEPTRELANQVYDALKDYGRLTNLRCQVIYGGVGYEKQKESVKKGLDIIIATPGRLLDLLEQDAISLHSIQHLVLDECDRMLDMGFLPDVSKIIKKTPTSRQTLLFSATLPPEIQSICSWALKEPLRIEIGVLRSPAETVKHALYPVASSQKQELLLALLEKLHYQSILIFCRTKVQADRITLELKKANHAVVAMHADRSQSERSEALAGFKSGKYEVLVATDIAARGIDVASVTHVINYDIPGHPEDYVHRIGRTGRAQTEGDALTLITGEDLKDVAQIEHYIDQKIPRERVEGFNYSYTALLEQTEVAPAAAPRRSLRAGRSTSKRR
ncbi:MAG: DEAD/DEAH box helicase [Verrucomicrobiota bacterium]